MPTHTLKAGPARSIKEIDAYMTTVICPACGHGGLGTFGHDLQAGDEVATTHAQCAICDAYTDVTFRRGPGWGIEPTDAMHLAVGDEPSTLLPESHFRDTADRALQRLSRTNVEDRGAIVAWAGRVVEYLLELRKFRMAEGVELVPADRKNLNAAIDMLASCSESLPADIARLVDEKDP